jgi:hypothetical protein
LELPALARCVRLTAYSQSWAFRRRHPSRLLVRLRLLINSRCRPAGPEPLVLGSRGVSKELVATPFSVAPRNFRSAARVFVCAVGGVIALETRRWLTHFVRSLRRRHIVVCRTTPIAPSGHDNTR